MLAETWHFYLLRGAYCTRFPRIARDKKRTETYDVLIAQANAVYRPTVGGVQWGAGYNELQCTSRAAEGCAWDAVKLNCVCAVSLSVFDTRKGKHIPRYPPTSASEDLAARLPPFCI